LPQGDPFSFQDRTKRRREMRCNGYESLPLAVRTNPFNPDAKAEVE